MDQPPAPPTTPRHRAAAAAASSSAPWWAASGPLAALQQLRAALSVVRVAQVVYLAWVHSVIGFGFFILLSWIPAYLSSMGGVGGGGSLQTVGLLSAAPWAVCAAVGIAAGTVADTLANVARWRDRTQPGHRHR